MPTLVIHGMPNDKREYLIQLKLDLKSVVGGVTDMGVRPDQVSVYFPDDLVPEELGRELKCFMPGTFTNSQRTPAVLDEVACAVRDVLTTFVKRYISPKCKLVEVYIGRFDPTNGFADWST